MSTVNPETPIDLFDLTFVYTEELDEWQLVGKKQVNRPFPAAGPLC